MQVKQSVKLRDVLWSYLTIILNAGINILILPAVLRYLPPNELGLWYVFVSFGAFVSIFEDSINAILIRNVGYACTGAKNLKKRGLDKIIDNLKPNLSLLKSIIETIRRLFIALSLFVFLIFITGGTYYINKIASEINFSYWITAWLTYSFAIALNLYFAYWRPVLLGMNLVSESNKSIIVAKIIQLILTFLGMIMGYGLIAMAIAYLLSGISARMFNIMYFNKNISKEYRDIPKLFNYKEVFNIMSYNIVRFGLILTGNYLVSNSIVFLSSYYMGLNVTAQYGLTVQLFAFSKAVGSTFFNASFPSINMARIKKDLEFQRKYVSLGIVSLLVTNVFALLFLIALGNKILSMFSEQQILPTFPLLILGIAITFESVTGCFTRYISTSNDLPYVKSVVISGIITVILCFITLNLFSTSIIFLILIRLFVQFAYNNWKWPSYALNELNIKYADIIKISFFEFKNKLMGSLRSDLHI